MDTPEEIMTELSKGTHPDKVFKTLKLDCNCDCDYDEDGPVPDICANHELLEDLCYDLGFKRDYNGDWIRPSRK